MKTTPTTFMTKLITLVFLSVLSASIFAGNDFRKMSQQELLQNENEKLLILDVRTVEEYQNGHVEDAVNLPVANISESINMFNDKDQKIVVYCRSGRRAGNALQFLTDNGFTNLYHLEGDMSAWEKADLPLSKPED